MKKRLLRKLVLTKETLRGLEDGVIRGVAGGQTRPYLCFSDPTICTCAGAACQSNPNVC